jgi:hypothetical protein
VGRIVNSVNSDLADAKSAQDQQNAVRPTIRLEYVPLRQAQMWDWVQNPKEHDIGGIIESIQRYGFRDPPELDAALGAFVQGNGRVQALAMMRTHGDDIPKYIGETDGDWAVPVIFGADAESEAAARAYAIDANNLVLSGGDLGFGEIMALYDKEQMAAIAALATEPMVTFDAEALSIIAGNKPEKEVGGLQRWAFVVEFEGEDDLLEELEDLMGMYFMPRSKRKLMPEFFAAMVRSYCANQPVVITSA